MCTTLIVTPGATADGSMMVAHSDDDELSDQRIVLVPAQDHPPGSKREVFAEHYRYPRMVTDQRGPGYKKESLEPLPDPPPDNTPPIGWIPQVGPTHAYFDGNYGIMNEHNLMIGECTDAATRSKAPGYVTAEMAAKEGKHIRILYTSELSRIALERCRTAKKAIKTMGDLVEEYGYYSSGETLLVADQDEAWVFEVCALPDDQYHSVWVAQRVPKGEVFVAANEFRIRDVKQKPGPDDPEIVYSKMLFPGLEKVGWWHPEDGTMDWLSTVSQGEYCHPYYSLRRVWRILDRVNPDLGLSPWVEDGFTREYPFSIKPNRKLTVRDVFSLYRDHYEDTPFDLTRGVAAGPYGDPHRFLGPYDGKPNAFSDQHLYGAWERPISVFYQGYTYVNQLRPGKTPDAPLGITWFGPDVAYTTCFMPLPTQVLNLPKAYRIGDPQVFRRDAAWWAFDFVGNWARLNFQRMTRVDILPKQEELELALLERLAQLEEEVRDLPPDEAARRVTRWCEENAERVLAEWWRLADTLVAKYSDGYVNLPDPDAKATDVGYDAVWLSKTNYKEGPTTYDMKPS